ncbi:MAG: hypothetical protein JXA89_04970 [Anaerolineae bacterium]|nr:hypothetical protein [Anaerolineae bacterium]
MDIVLISSSGRCGIREYSCVLAEGFRSLGHRASYIGVERHNNKDLARCIRQIKRSDELVILEYEPGIFWMWGTVLAMAWLRFWRRKQVFLSVHEIEPAKYHKVRQIQWHLSRPIARNRAFELVKLGLSVADVLQSFLKYRIGLLLMGWLPHVVLIHSAKGRENVGLILNDGHKARYVPLVIEQIEGDRDALRAELGLPVEPFAFIVPGFLFRRKRITTVIEQLPPGAELWVVGTESPFESGYLDEIHTFLGNCSYRERVRLFHDYDRLEHYLVAADAAIFYYSEGFQSAAASLAVGAGKPCIFSDLPAFSDLREAGLVVRSPAELHHAMCDIQESACYDRLAKATLVLREQLSPERIARQYLDSQAGKLE